MKVKELIALIRMLPRRYKDFEVLMSEDIADTIMRKVSGIRYVAPNNRIVVLQGGNLNVLRTQSNR